MLESDDVQKAPTAITQETLSKFNQFLENSCSVFLDLSKEEYEQYSSEEKNKNIMRQFLSASQNNYLIIISSTTGQKVSFNLDISIQEPGEGILILKKNYFSTENYKSLKNQFHIFCLGEVSKEIEPVELAKVCINNALNPLLSSLNKQVNSNEIMTPERSDELAFISEVQKRFDTIDIMLLSNSQKVPDVKLNVEGIIVEICNEAIKNRQVPSLTNVPPELLKDENFLNRLGECFKKWHEMCMILRKHSDDASFNSLLSEIEYWENYLANFINVKKQFEKPEIKLTLEILGSKKKQFVESTDELKAKLNEKMEYVEKIVLIFQKFPIKEFFASRKLDNLLEHMRNIFTGIEQLVNHFDYQSEKLTKTIENFSYDLIIVLTRFLQAINIMFIPFEEFEKLCDDIRSNLRTIWAERTNKLSRDNVKVIMRNPHTKLIDRIQKLLKIRDSHETLKEALKEMDISRGERIQQIFNDCFKNNSQILEISAVGEAEIERNKSILETEMALVEKEVILKLKEMLGSAKNQTQMLNIFLRFSKLLKRDRILLELTDSKEQLFNRMLETANNLVLRTRKHYDSTASKEIGRFYNMHQISGYQIWFTQTKNALTDIKDQTQQLFGKKSTNENKITNLIENFMKQSEELKLKNFNDKEFEVVGPVLGLEAIPRSNSFKLIVNFSKILLIKFHEYRNSVKIKTESDMMKLKLKKEGWPVLVNASKLIESVETWNEVAGKIDERMTMLLAKQLKKAYLQIEKGIKNDTKALDGRETEFKDAKFVANFGEAIKTLYQAATILAEKIELIEEEIKKLQNCEMEYLPISKIIDRIQEVIDKLILEEFTNMDVLTNEINIKIEKSLSKRLSETLQLWTEEFTKFKTFRGKGKNKNKLITIASIHEILVKNTTIYIEPPIQQARIHWLNDLHQLIHIVSCQKRLIINRYSTIVNTGTLKYFSDIISKLAPNVLTSCYRILRENVGQAERYVRTWLSYKALWEIKVSDFYQRFGKDMATWQIVLNEIKQGRNTFDNSNTDINYGPIIINYKSVQLKINNAYDTLHKSILYEFGKNYNQNVDAIFEKVGVQKLKLEKINFANPSELVENVSALVTCKENFENWEKGIKECLENEKLLQTQKYHFDENAKNSDQIGKEWSRFKNLFNAKSSQFESNLESIKDVLAKEEEKLMAKISEIETLWNTKKPFSSELHPKEALEVLKNLETAISENNNNLTKLKQIKILLNLPPIETDIINLILEDSANLRELWNMIQTTWEPIDATLETAFAVCNPVQFTKLMDNINEKLNDYPQKYKTHEVVIGKKKEIQNLKKKNRLLRDIKSDAVKETHLIQIAKKLGLTKPINDLLVGDFFKADLNANEKAINEIISQAQGQLVLESMIAKIKDFWNNENFQTSKYQNKCLLIKGWDELMNKAEEDLGQLNSMKLSQHFKTFEAEIKGWNEKVLNISNVLSAWMDVQRKWVYLEAIFMGGSDIKTQLASEYQKFGGVDREFTGIMKLMASKIKVLDTITAIPNLLKTLEYLSETLDKIQKNLSDYLETQRQSFARFYFVGDEDLLEIIGNSKEIASIQKHFSKMFAGIHVVEADRDQINSMSSKEHEVVPFDKTIKISEFQRINDWLTELERNMQVSLHNQLEKCLLQWKDCNEKNLRELVDKFPTQSILLGFQTLWTFLVEDCLISKKELIEVEKKVISLLSCMAEEVLKNIPKLTRKRYEQLITEMVHKRDVTRKIGERKGMDVKDFKWQYFMRYYIDTEQSKGKGLKVKMGTSEFAYGHEYLGITDKLVQTPLTDKCYFTLTQALWLRMGGAPFGPAGTGKTESVKALGCCLGRFVLVFNCDETFNFKAMGRIFIGLCQVGAWGCFDEFNRLEERILSAVSQQILAIQTGLREKVSKIVLMNKPIGLNINMGVFVTMNPGYAGRSNLPENLKQLFRQMAMIKPDSILIAQVMLFSQGFKSAEELSGKVVSLFELCGDQLSSQPHYDFGLRALKSVLISAGNLKRKVMSEDQTSDAHSLTNEQKIILRSFCDTVVPKLISEDTPLLKSLIHGVFPGSEIPPIEDKVLSNELQIEFERRFLRFGNQKMVEKVLQLNQILKLAHGIMLVGPTGCGKSAAWKSLLSALTKVDGIKGESYIIDPKSLTKEELYGKLDNTTMEWTDGIFTYILRKICENQRGESSKRHWVVFDGDVDPEWAENLNSVLDDNKLLTLPNGERLQIPPNMKLLFEVESLKYATLATVSRCGMVWFSEDILVDTDIYSHYLLRLKEENYDSIVKKQEIQGKEAFALREICVKAIQPLFIKENDKSFCSIALELAETEKHVMEFSRIRLLEALFALIRKGITKVVEYDEAKFGNYSADKTTVLKFMINWTLFAINWAFVGDLKLNERSDYLLKLKNTARDLPEGLTFPPVDDATTLIDYEVRLEDGEFSLWRLKVPQMDINPEKVTSADLIITTVDTLRHQEVLCSWLLEHRPFIICGPPGSGKTMTLMSTLRNLQDFEMIFVNFSSSTTPALILKQFEHYCEFSKGPTGITLRPRQPNKWLVVFCDEINLPDEDKYGTQYIITFLRQLTEQHGYWRSHDKTWVTLERIQFVGACNPPTDSGRHPLAPRFLRHCPLILVDFPGYDSLIQIYGTFNKGMLKNKPLLIPYWEALTTAMVQYYTQSQKRFSSDQQPHYIYSPRDLTRWKYAINEALESISNLEELVRLWAHEALRLFEDKLVTDAEKSWCQEKVDEISKHCFAGIDPVCLTRPILFSTYITKFYQTVKRDELREYILEKLKIFNEEEFDVQLVVFDEVLDHITKIDRVLRQPIGHMLLVGASGVGKTTLSRLVSWINGLKVFQIKAGRNYNLQNFDDDLRDVMKRSGCRLEKITFIFDESNVLGVAFLERMNALLASGEVPGLFEGEEFMSLINTYKEAQGSKGRETEEEIYAAFTKNVQRNLHVVFTMNPANPDFSNRTASSPAIFNRCVIDWFGDWSEDALIQVAKELTELNDYSKEVEHSVIVGLIVRIHKSVKKLNDKLKGATKKYNFLTPRDYLDFIRRFCGLLKEKKDLLNEQQYHLNKGLNSLKETESKVFDLKKSLDIYEKDLEEKKIDANQKLEMIMEQQKQSNEKIDSSKILAGQIQIKKTEIEKRNQVVQRDLDNVGPALEKAKNSVSGISPASLNEVRSYNSPPSKVKLALEAVFFLMRGKKIEWDQIKKEIAKPDFVKSVLEFDVGKCPPTTKSKMKSEYLESAEWNLEKILSSSKAAGPLADWAQSQVFYAEILEQVKPMTDEIASMAKESATLEATQTELTKTIEELGEKIKSLKKEYGELISKTEELKSEKEKVKKKIQKSENLMAGLSSEKVRWEASKIEFASQFKTLTGDVLYSSAFLTYIGFFDQFYRQVLMNTWANYLTNARVNFKKEMSLVEYLSLPSERISWQAKGLPADDLCTQNAIILNRYSRYPLVIDPSGQAIDFILNLHSEGEKKMVRTSFIDDGFMKQLETCLRFGLPILIQDVEKIEPILNSVLNKEIIKQGGRILIRVGDQEIDFSSEFKLFMITRNADAKFTPDLCSRVTFVNFTVTKSSLENQFINIYLKNERPDVEEKRINLLKLQGEFIVKLRELENSLLNELSKVEGGNILENDEVIQTLENLKSQSTKIKAEMEQSDEVLKEIGEVTDQYKPIASNSSKLYFVLERMGDVNIMYQFSLKFYMKIVLKILDSNEQLKTIPHDRHQDRINVIEEQLFNKVWEKIGHSVLEPHKLLFAIRFAQTKIDGLFNKNVQDLFKVIFAPAKLIETTLPPTFLKGLLTKEGLIRLEDLSLRPGFNNMLSSMKQNTDKWERLISDHSVMEFEDETFVNLEELGVSDSQNKKAESIVKKIIEVIILNILRPEKALKKMRVLIDIVLTPEFMRDHHLNLQEAVEEDSDCKSPLLLACAPGFDASSKIFELSKIMKQNYEDVAIGSGEGFEMAQKMIDLAQRTGSWVILRNVHLAPTWLKELEQYLYRMSPHRDFRLFLLMEFSDKIPLTLLRQSVKFIFELPDGVKASVRRTLNSVLNESRSNRSPHERCRLHFLLSWIHGVIMERLRYTPTGWSKKYEFSEADQKCALDIIDEYIDLQGTRQNLPLEQIPFEALRSIIAENIYGGKIDNEFDLKILKSIIDQYLSPESFDPKKALIQDKNGSVLNPDAINFIEFKNWAEKLDNAETPVWAGLPPSANDFINIQRLGTILTNLATIQSTNEEEVSLEEKSDEQNKVSWLIELAERVKNYLELLPSQLTKLERNEALISNPLFRFLEREITLASNLLDKVRKTLKEVEDMAEGRAQPLQDTKKMANSIYSNEIPKTWLKYVVPETIGLANWIKDFKNRIDQLSLLHTTKDWQRSGINIGEFLFPEAFITATRQFVAQKNGLSMDELELRISIAGSGMVDENSILVKNMWIEGVNWTKESLQLGDEMVYHLKNIQLTWTKTLSANIKKLKEGEIFVPFYLNSTRRNLILAIKFDIGNSEIKEKQLYQRGIAFSVWRMQ